MPFNRRSASASPSTASPSRLRFSRVPSVRSFASVLSSCAGVASMTRWLTIFRSMPRAMGTIGRGNCGAKPPPKEMAARRYQGRNAGMCRLRRSRLRPATFRSSGRTTRSTKPRVKSSPRGSFSTPARRSALASGAASADSASHRRTVAIVSSARSRGSGAVSDCCVGMLTRLASHRHAVRGGVARPPLSCRAGRISRAQSAGRSSAASFNASRTPRIAVVHAMS